jgi:AhpD family alkylhydroperoxidase
MQLNESARRALPGPARDLVLVRASQINGCSYCLDMHTKEAKQVGETNERLNLVAAWRDADCFNEGERAALALTEAATRLSDRADPVPEELWAEVSRHFDEPALAALVLNIALVNLWNRVSVTLRAKPGMWVASPDQERPAA